MRVLLILISLFLLTGCKSEVELTLERGIQYYEWAVESNGSNVDKAVIEFKFFHSFGNNPQIFRPRYLKD